MSDTLENLDEKLIERVVDALCETTDPSRAYDRMAMLIDEARNRCDTMRAEVIAGVAATEMAHMRRINARSTAETGDTVPRFGGAVRSGDGLG